MDINHAAWSSALECEKRDRYSALIYVSFASNYHDALVV